MERAAIPTAPPVARLIELFTRLPGIGPKGAQRLTYYLLRVPAEEARALAGAIIDVRDRVGFCSTCHNITEHDPCLFCSDERRDRSAICVVEEPLDTLALERSGVYSGLYHVLHGALSPIDGIGPEQLGFRELVRRVQAGGVREVIVATNPNLAGEATAMYLRQLLAPLGVRLTRLARGLPMGGDVEDADEVTLARALEGRQEL